MSSLVLTDEEKAFLQEGFNNYAPALLALAEFRRRIASRLQNVLDEFSSRFDELGLSITGLTVAFSKLHDQNLGDKKAWIGLNKNYGAGLDLYYYVQWNFDKPERKQLWVRVWFPGGNRVDRNRLFSAMHRIHSLDSATELKQESDGIYLTAYCDAATFHNFDATFRTMVEEWIRLLSAIEGGLHKYLPSKASAASEDGS